MPRRDQKQAIAIASLSCLAIVLAGAPWPASAEDAPDFSTRVQAALDDEARPDAERARDANRKPVQTLAFFGIRSDMDVLELVPGGGWYSRLLAPALAGTGSLSVWIGVDRFADRFASLALEDVKIAAPGTALEPTEQRGIFSLPAVDLGADAYDAVLTFRNLHNLTPEARATLHRAVFTALRPGGVYGVVDHTRRHMAPDERENWRRLDPVVAIHEALAAGFVFEDWSDLHHRLDDELRYEVGRRSVSGNTDRFTLRFRKPR